MNPEKKVQELYKSIERLGTKMKNLKAPQETTCFVLGLTGSGKSTLISMLLGAEIICKKEGLRYVLEMQKSDHKYPEIGNSALSCTEAPTLYRADNNVCYYDPPGFLDTKGTEQEVVNAYANSKILLRGTKAVLLILIEQSTLLSSRGGALSDLTERIFQLFGANDFSYVTQACLLVITKCDLGQASENDYKGELKDIVKTIKTLHPACKLLLEKLLFSDRIFFFPTPKAKGKLDIQRVSAIKKEVLNLIPAVLESDASVSLSPKAEMMVSSLIQDLQVSNEMLINSIRQTIDNYKIADKTTKLQEINSTLQKLNKAKIILSNEDFLLKRQVLTELLTLLCIQEDLKEKMLKNLIFIQFCVNLKKKTIQGGKSKSMVMISIMEYINKLEKRAQQILKKKEFENIMLENQQKMKKKQDQFKEAQKQLRMEEKQREERAREDLLEQTQFMTAMMNSLNQQHSEQLKALSNQLRSIENQRIKDDALLIQQKQQQKKELKSLKSQIIDLKQKPKLFKFCPIM